MSEYTVQKAMLAGEMHAEFLCNILLNNEQEKIEMYLEIAISSAKRFADHKSDNKRRFKYWYYSGEAQFYSERLKKMGE